MVAVLVLVVVAGVIALAVAMGDGFRDTDVRPAPSGAWLATQGVTNIAHVHAGTRQVDARVNVARAVPGIGDIAVSQGDTGIYLIDGSGCAVHRFDEVRQDLAKRPEPKLLVPDGSDCGAAVVVQGDGHTFLVDGTNGRVEEIDPVGLDERAVVELGRPVAGVAVADGGLLVAAPADGSAPVLVRDGRVDGTVDVPASTTPAEVSRVGDRVVLVDGEQGRLVVLDDAGEVDRRVSLGLDGDLELLGAQEGGVAWVGADGGTVVGVDLASGRVLGPHDVVADDGVEPAGPPAGVGDAVVVPLADLSVALFDAVEGTERGRVSVGDGAVAAGAALEVVAVAGRVFVHPPDGRRAAACDAESCRGVDKQDAAVEEVEATPPEEEDPPVTATTVRRSTTTTAPPSTTTTTTAPPTTTSTSSSSTPSTSTVSTTTAPQASTTTTTIAAPAESPDTPGESSPAPTAAPAPPGPVALDGEPQVTATTVTLRWQAAPSSVAPVWYELEVDESPQSLPGPGADQPLSHTITGLTPETTVSLRLRGVNAVGPGPWTVRSVTPSAAVPVAVRASDSSADICRAYGEEAPCDADDGGGQVVVFWEPPAGGGVDTFDVACGGGLVSGVGAPGAGGQLVPAPDGRVVTCVVVSVVDGRGIAEARSGAVTARGRPPAPGTPTQQDRTVTWAAVDGADGYIVRTDAPSAPSVDVGQATSLDLAARIPSAGTSRVWVVATNDRGESDESAATTFVRRLDPPQVSVGEPAFDQPAGTVSLSWAADPVNQPTYRLRTTTPGTALDCGGPCSTLGSSLTVRVSGVADGQSVTIEVLATIDNPALDRATDVSATVSIHVMATTSQSDLSTCTGDVCVPSGESVGAGERVRVLCVGPDPYHRVRTAGGVTGFLQLAALTPDEPLDALPACT